MPHWPFPKLPTDWLSPRCWEHWEGLVTSWRRLPVRKRKWEKQLQNPLMRCARSNVLFSPTSYKCDGMWVCRSRFVWILLLGSMLSRCFYSVSVLWEKGAFVEVLWNIESLSVIDQFQDIILSFPLRFVVIYQSKGSSMHTDLAAFDGRITAVHPNMPHEAIHTVFSGLRAHTSFPCTTNWMAAARSKINSAWSSLRRQR